MSPTACLTDDPIIVTTAERVAADVPGVRHAHARARWTGRTLRVEIDGWVDADTTVTAADDIGRVVSERLSRELPDMRSFTWTAHGI
jgi:divalent metal cation (Fe/Co/Zn/Cd) transporter